MRPRILGTLASLGMALTLAVPNARAQDVVTLTMPVIDANIWHGTNGPHIRDLSDDTDPDPFGRFVIADTHVNEACAT